ncbi:uncharacterized protein LOC113328795 [Papaver somniferum]|uniref:uncharacterized protein LOC113328795 n=1 Tax=Papaver somniferum TaxID=3469 RepID=UPI000E6FC132|nr:uncharacterized protein LOC113328795 [Papaver somniferum]
MTRISPIQEKHENGNEGTSARTRPFTFEEIMLRRKKNRSSSEVEAEAEESEKLLVKGNDVTIQNHSEFGEAHEEIKIKASGESEKISSTREQVSTSVEEDQLGRKDNENFDAKTYLVEKLDKEVSDSTKEEKSEIGSRFSSRNEEMRAVLENETDKDTKSRVEGDKKEKHSHHRSRNEETLEDNLEKEPDKVTKSKGKRDKTEKSRHYRIRNEEISRDDMEVESNKDIRNVAKGDKNKTQSRHGSRKEERSTDVSENKPDKDMESKAKADRNEKSSHPKSRNDEISRADVEVQPEKGSWRKKTSSGTEKRKSDTETKRKQHPGGYEKDSSELDGNAVKKHDSGKRYDSETVGRKGRRESSPSHYDEERPKRRRSRSREKKDKDRRSISDFPREHKRTSYKEQEHESSRKSYPDADKNKMSSNSGYGSSHYHRHGGHESRLGGYSPRKRRTDSAVKTPSPTPRSPERKSAGWDLPPTGTDIQNSHQILSSSVNEVPAAVLVRSNSATKKAVSSGSSSTTPSASKNSTADNVQLTSPRRRLLVENVPTSASDEHVMECFNNFFLPSDAYHIQGTLPCIHCSMNKEKGQALVEFLTPEDATTALSFNGKLFSGSILKVRRPKDFAESATGVSQKPVTVVDKISDVVKDSSNKIFVGGIAKVLSSDMVKEIASAFGALRAYHFEVNESASEACAFLEYVDKSITLKACAGLNGMKLGGEVLTVVQATPDASVVGGIEEPPCYAVPEYAKPLLSKATKVLKLHNVLNEEELSTLSGQQVEEVLEDVRLECARYGAVKSINIVRNVDRPTTAPGEIINQASLMSSSPQIENCCNVKKVEPTGVEVDPNSGETRGPAALGDVRETLVDGADTTNSIPNHAENEERKRDTIISTSYLGCDTVFQESPSQLDKSKNQSVQAINSSDDFPSCNNCCTENSNVVEEEELKSGEADLELHEASIKLNDTSTKDSKDNNENIDMTDIFEVGCILVEYARTETSCIAAHCLHGRLFGDKTVTVGYVDHDQYMSRFSK